MQQIQSEHQQFIKKTQSHHFYLEQWVEIRSNRPNREQFNGMQGQITAISNNDIIYVAIRHYNPCFYPYELHPVKGGVA